MENLLKSHKLKVTPNRLTVLKVFVDSDSAISLPTLQNQLPASFDRVTLYRTLQAFEKNGVIHKVMDHDQQAVYALCPSDCNTENHEDNHPHFKCRVCGNSYCMNELTIPEVTLPKGYVMESKNFLIEGICEDCSSD